MTTPLTFATGERIAGPDRAPAEMLDVRVVAALLQCSPRHVYRLCDAGKMPPPMKLGALVRWSRTALNEWIAAGCPTIRQEARAVR
jgi:excisionase family DNA binding protein